MTTLTCEECGKIYHLDPEKLKNRIPGEGARTRCRECGYLMRIPVSFSHVSEAGSDEKHPAETFHSATDTQDGDCAFPGGRGDDEGIDHDSPLKISIGLEGDSQVGGIGIRTKMFFLFLVLPLIFLAILGFLSQRQMNALLKTFSEESVSIVTSMAEEKVVEISHGIAKQVALYLELHPDLDPMDFNYDPEFRNIVIQRIEERGYTILIEKPHPGESDYLFRIRMHPEANFILSDQNIERMIKRTVGPKFRPLFAKIMAGEEIRFNYLWEELNKDVREKFGIVVPVKGTNFFVFACVYTDESLASVSKLEREAQKLIQNTRIGIMVILAAALFIMGLIILYYGYTISKNIQILTNAANKISLGRLDTKIEVSTKDEIGALATAISRMQDSLKLSFARLKRK